MEKKDLVRWVETAHLDALRLCGNSTQAEDLVQEAMLAALAQFERGQDIESPRTWLNHTMRNLFNQQLRKKYRLPLVSFGETAETAIDDLDLSRLEQQEEYAAVRRELSHLGRLYRECMVLYYVKGCTVREIAAQLHIPENTVKSRLMTGRQKMKEGMDMTHSYSPQSYEPVRMWISECGCCGRNGEPFSLCPPSDVLTQNILYTAYAAPLTEAEIARALGVSPAYVEPLVQKLVDGELMVRTAGGRVYTDFILNTAADKMRTFPLQKQVAAEQFDRLWPVVEQGLSDLRQQPVYIRQTAVQRRNMEMHFCIHTFCNGVYQARNRVLQVAFADPPERPNGGAWLAFGSVEKAGDTYPADFSDFDLSGEFSTGYTDAFGVKKAGYAEYGMGRRGHIGPRLANGGYLVEFLTAIATGTDLANTSLSAAAYERITEFVQDGLLEMDGDTPRLAVPVVSTAERKAYMETANACAKQVEALLVEPLRPVMAAGEVKLPPHLTSVPRERQFMEAVYRMPMMFLRQAVESGRLQENEHSHALLFILDR